MNDNLNDAEIFFALAQSLYALLQRARDGADMRGSNGRRFALVATKIEEAWLQAKQGQDEAAG